MFLVSLHGFRAPMCLRDAFAAPLDLRAQLLSDCQRCFHVRLPLGKRLPHRQMARRVKLAGLPGRNGPLGVATRQCRTQLIDMVQVVRQPLM